MILDPQVLHVLAANVDDRGDAGLDEFCSAIVRHGFDFAFIHGERCGDQTFAVSGCTGSANHGPFGQFTADPSDNLYRCSDGVTFVGGIVGEDNPVIFVDENSLDGG